MDYFNILRTNKHVRKVKSNEMKKKKNYTIKWD